MNETLWNYLRRDKKSVGGWLQRVDAEIIGSILEFQLRELIVGSCVEIGVHHGKSFIALCLGLRSDELALCIDVLDDQGKNLDSSGRGSIDQLQANLARFHIESARVRIFKGSSEDITSTQILEQVGPVRLFSVDGGHWCSIVRNDLLLAEKTLALGGVVVLDDYCRSDWPDVTYGYAVWQEQTDSDIIPFAIGSNKLFMCRSEYAKAYRAALRTPFLQYYFSKTYRSREIEVDCYRVEPFNQDEESARGAFGLSLKLFRPATFVTLKSILRRMSKRS